MCPPGGALLTPRGAPEGLRPGGSPSLPRGDVTVKAQFWLTSKNTLWFLGGACFRGVVPRYALAVSLDWSKLQDRRGHLWQKVQEILQGDEGVLGLPVDASQGSAPEATCPRR